jgi:hypothetical protein
VEINKRAEQQQQCRLIGLPSPMNGEEARIQGFAVAAVYLRHRCRLIRR